MLYSAPGWYGTYTGRDIGDAGGAGGAWYMKLCFYHGLFASVSEEEEREAQGTAV